MTERSPARVALWMGGSVLSFTVMALSIRALGPILNVFEILALRSGTGLIVLLLLIAARPDLRPLLRSNRLGLQLLRNTFHFAGQAGWAKAVILLPFATAFAIEFTTPAWVTLLAILVLGERLTPSRAGAVGLGILGVLVILRPGLSSFQPAGLFMLGAAFSLAIALICTKKLTATEQSFTIVFWMNTMQLPMNLLGSDPLFLLRLDASYALPVLGLTVSGLTGHYCFATAFRYGDATTVVPMDFLRIPLIAVIGWAVYGEHLDLWVFVGAALIIGGILWNLRAEQRGR